MHKQSYKFSFLVCWCILLSMSIVIMVAMIARESKQWTLWGKNGTGGDPRVEFHIDPGQNSVDYIQLVWGGQESPPWKHSSSCFCDNTTLLLQNDSVKIKTRGFYHIYVQVTFMPKNKTQERTVTLVANKNVPSKTPRKLSEAEEELGTVSMSGVFYLNDGDSVSLHISPASEILRQPSKTYWGLFLLAKRKNHQGK